ncbi:MAG TPA: TonB-dependent receptor [Sphingomicrobium sp.]|nr:TonB-dependent receptor [Sphingomicrobium sp.]
MSRSILRATLRAALLTSVIGAGVPSLAMAQQARPSTAATQPAAVPEEDSGEVIVTARRRNEALQDVPIAITSYSGEALERQGAVDITDIGDTTPNVTFEVSRGTNSTLTAFIRGVGQQDPVAGFEQGVGLYLDDVYLNRPQGAVLDIYDVERIEVLRGPQGTLYGRNTIGGAIKYVTRRLANRPVLNLRGTVGTYGQLDAIATASYPVADMLRIGASFARLKRDGFGKNFTTGDENYNKNVRAGRVSAEIGRNDDAMLRVSADYTRDTSNPRGGHRLITSLLTKTLVLTKEYNSRGGLDDPDQKVISKGAAVHGQFRLADGLVFKSITAVRRDTSGTPIDFDALPTIDLDVAAVYENKQFSQEFQLVYDRGPLSGLVGAYYLKADALTAFDVRVYTLAPTLPGLTASTESDVDTKTWAFFGDFTYDFSDQLSASVGGRYTNDKRSARVLRQTRVRGGTSRFGGAAGFGEGAVIATTSDFEGSRTDIAFTPRASVSFKPNGNHHFYASYSKGFKGGGFDPRGQTTQAPDFNRDGVRGADDIYEYMAFDPEEVVSTELGWKGSMLDKRIFAGVALFNADYKDVQIPTSIGCVINNLPNFCGLTSNAGKARFRGVEVEGNARLFGNPGGSRINFGWSLGYLDAKFQEFLSFVSFDAATGRPIPPVEVDVADFRRIQNTPKWTASGTLSYATPLYQGDLNLSSTLSYRSASRQFEGRSPLLDQKGFKLLDASATYELPGGHWTFGLHGKNLTDTRYKTSGYNFLTANPFTGDFILPTGAPGFSPGAGLGREGVLTAYYGNPRQILFTVGYKY